MKIMLWASFAPLLLAGCTISTALTPRIAAQPGPNKSPQAFAADQANCKQSADRQIADARNATVQQINEAIAAENEGGPMVSDSAVAGAVAALQEPYDSAYAQCMVAQGNQVPGYIAPPPVARYVRPDPVRARPPRRARPRREPAAAQAGLRERSSTASDTAPAAPQSFVEPPASPETNSAPFVEPAPAK